jgi:hypothetical protein
MTLDDLIRNTKHALWTAAGTALLWGTIGATDVNAQRWLQDPDKHEQHDAQPTDEAKPMPPLDLRVRHADGTIHDYMEIDEDITIPVTDEAQVVATFPDGYVADWARKGWDVDFYPDRIDGERLYEQKKQDTITGPGGRQITVFDVSPRIAKRLTFEVEYDNGEGPEDKYDPSQLLMRDKAVLNPNVENAGTIRTWADYAITFTMQGGELEDSIKTIERIERDTIVTQENNYDIDINVNVQQKKDDIPDEQPPERPTPQPTSDTTPDTEDSHEQEAAHDNGFVNVTYKHGGTQFLPVGVDPAGITKGLAAELHWTNRHVTTNADISYTVQETDGRRTALTNVHGDVDLAVKLIGLDQAYAGLGAGIEWFSQDEAYDGSNPVQIHRTVRPSISAPVTVDIDHDGDDIIYLQAAPMAFAEFSKDGDDRLQHTYSRTNIGVGARADIHINPSDYIGVRADGKAGKRLHSYAGEGQPTVADGEFFQASGELVFFPDKRLSFTAGGEYTYSGATFEGEALDGVDDKRADNDRFFATFGIQYNF